MKIKWLFFVLLMGLGQNPLTAQEVYLHISNKSIYAFLDELANDGFIELNSAVKPYSRRFIAEKLEQTVAVDSLLNRRQHDELQFYLRDFNKELQPGRNFRKRFDILYYKDSLFTFSLNPIAGIQYWTNENGTNYHRWNGAEVFSYVGTHIGVYANLRDNHEDKLLVDTNDLSPWPGAVYKSGQDYSEMRGGITYSWRWGSFGLIKDHLEWGNYYHYPSIISGKAPSFTLLKLVMKPVHWFEFNYIHGWLVSGVVDSLQSYSYNNSYGNNNRIVYRKKFIAANLFTFKPLRHLYASLGNSIVYSDMGVQPAYLIPFMFYKSIDHTLNNASSNETGQNSQLFMDISSRQIRHLHLYATLFFDDLSFTRFWKNGHFDYYSLNTGFQLTDLVPNTFFTFEYFQSYPLVYKHIIPTTTYESNFYNLGHYMQDNSRSFYTELTFRPLRGLETRIHYILEQHGPDHEMLGTDRLEVVHMFLDTVEWENRELGISITYQIINDVYVFCDFVHRAITGDAEKYTAPYYQGTTNTFSIGLNYGF
jgi:hypothetical protein